MKIQYDTYQVPDKIDVFQNGVWLGGTGPATTRSSLRRALSCGSATAAKGYIGATGTFTFLYDPAKGNSVEVVVSGCEDGGTLWQYTISCPQETPVATFTYDGNTILMPVAGYIDNGNFGGLIFSTSGVSYSSATEMLTGSGSFFYLRLGRGPSGHRPTSICGGRI